MPFSMDKKWFTRDIVKKFFDFLLENDWVAYPTQLKGALIYKNTDKDGYEISFSFPTLDNIKWESLSLLSKFTDIISVVADFYIKTPEDFFYSLVLTQDSVDTILLKFHEGENIDSIAPSTFLPLLKEVYDTIIKVFASSNDKTDPRALSGKVRLGHTFEGSYGIALKIPFQIQYPLPLNNEDIPEEIRIPPERRTVEKVFKLLGIVSLHSEDDAETLLVESCKESPILCSYLRNIISKTDDTGVVFELLPSKGLPLNEQVPNVALHVKRKMLLPVNKAISAMSQEINETSIIETFTGIVTDFSKGKKTIFKDERLTIRFFSQKFQRKITISNVMLAVCRKHERQVK